MKEGPDTKMTEARVRVCYVWCNAFGKHALGRCGACKAPMMHRHLDRSIEGFFSSAYFTFFPSISGIQDIRVYKKTSVRCTQHKGRVQKDFKMDSTDTGARGGDDQLGGGNITLSSGQQQGARLGVIAPGDSAYSTTTVSTGVDPTTGQPLTTYQTYTVGAVPASADDGTTAAYATYQTYTTTTMGVPVGLSAGDVGGGGGGGGGIGGRIEDITGMDTGGAGTATPTGDIGKGGGGGGIGGRGIDVTGGGGGGGGGAGVGGETMSSGEMAMHGGGDDDTVGGMGGGGGGI
ncbi:hypothetical protein Vretifemale_3730 [Volvox reticuliferus]|nr:hypothetical protein Vretifemale_3730 [Volvox reticuliferus]